MKRLFQHYRPIAVIRRLRENRSIDACGLPSSPPRGSQCLRHVCRGSIRFKFPSQRPLGQDIPLHGTRRCPFGEGPAACRTSSPRSDVVLQPVLIRRFRFCVNLMKTLKLSFFALLLTTGVVQGFAAPIDKEVAENRTGALTPEQSAAVEAAVQVIKRAPGALHPPVIRRDLEREELIKQLVACIGGGDAMRIEHSTAENLLAETQKHNPQIAPEMWDAIRQTMNEDIYALFSTNLPSSLYFITIDRVNAAHLSNDDIKRLISLYQREPLLSRFENSQTPDNAHGVDVLVMGNARIVTKIVNDALTINNAGVQMSTPISSSDALPVRH